MTQTRANVIAMLASAPFLAACALDPDAVRVGSKNFTESFVIAEIYAQALERAGVHVQRLFNLGSTQITMAAMRRGNLDCYPEYTGTALIDVLHERPINNPHSAYEAVREAFARRFDLVVLPPSPMNDSQGLATTRRISQRLGLRTLSDAARAAHGLRLATIQEFLARPDGLPGLQRTYGGFHFAEVRTFDIALKYRALLGGQADIATAFTTDGEIATSDLVLLRDDRHFWSAYSVAPVVRRNALAARPVIARTLDAVSPSITDRVVRAMNASVESQGADPADVAAAFLSSLRRTKREA